MLHKFQERNVFKTNQHHRIYVKPNYRCKSIKIPYCKGYMRQIQTRSSISIVDMSHYLGEGIILYTMFFCSLNYFMYKQMREDMENDDNDSNNN